MNILVVEDNLKLAANVCKVLTHYQYHVTHVITGSECLERLTADNYDLIILDLGLPDMDGQAVCARLRERHINLPILILTARADLQSKISGLDGGADDYLTKPFLMDELLARVRALLRRPSALKQSLIVIGSLTIDLSLRKVTRDTEAISLTPIEMRILEFLLLNVGQAKTNVAIYEAVWGTTNSDILFSDVLKVHVANLRKKLGNDLIETVSGFGYLISEYAA